MADEHRDPVLMRRMVTHDVRLREKDDPEDPDKGPILMGRGAVYGTETVIGGSFRESIRKGAFKESLKGDHDIYSTFNHRDDNLLGRKSAKTLRLKDGKEGLDFEVELNMETRVGRDVAAMARRGDLRGASIAFVVPNPRADEVYTQGNPQADDPTERMPLFEVKRGVLYEIGPVTNPAYEQTSIDVRSARERAAAHGPPLASELDVIELETEVLALEAWAMEDDHANEA